ncbi:MAG: flagellar basal body L-ring protein FlgH [Pseudomonadota bacterium]|nr:flagellar basal body L-ring protein FlgH [Pseudomonadota bacterium]
MKSNPFALVLLPLLACAHFDAVTSVAPPVVSAVSPVRVTSAPGSLWSEPEARALVGMDGNARRIGDLITVKVQDNSSTSLGADTNTGRTTDSSFGISALLGLETSIPIANPNMGGEISLGGNSESTMTGSGSTSRQGTLAATVTCQVMEVMTNGNLRIRGTKQVRVNRETQYLTLEGIVRPRDILMDNTIQSDFIAEARIEFTGAGVLADKQGPGWGTRVADMVWPF